MERISRNAMLLEMASVMAKRGTCARAQVGVVISRGGRIISTGYNGAPAGMPHCDHENDPILRVAPQLVDQVMSVSQGRIMVVPEPQITISGCQIAGHAEENAIAYAAQFGVSLGGSEVHCTHAPCYACSRMLVNAGIKSVTYVTPYRLTEGIELLVKAGIVVAQLLQDGTPVKWWDEFNPFREEDRRA